MRHSCRFEYNAKCWVLGLLYFNCCNGNRINITAHTAMHTLILHTPWYIFCLLNSASQKALKHVIMATSMMVCVFMKHVKGYNLVYQQSPLGSIHYLIKCVPINCFLRTHTHIMLCHYNNVKNMLP